MAHTDPKNLQVGAGETTASETTALQGGGAKDAFFAVADGETPLSSHTWRDINIGRCNDAGKDFSCHTEAGQDMS